MEESLTSNLFLVLILNLNQFFYGAFPAFMDSFAWFGRAFVVLYIVCVGLGLMTGHIQDAGREALFSVVMVSALWVGIMETTLYASWIVKPFLGTVNNLTGFFIDIQSEFDLGVGLSGLLHQIDIEYGRILTTIDRVIPTENIMTNFGIYLRVGFALLVLIFIYAVMYFAFVVMLALGYFSMFILFTVGGVCIFFAAFKRTRFIFWAWFRALINYGLLIVFTGLVMSICMYGVNYALTAMEAEAATKGVFTYGFFGACAWGALAVGMLLKCPDFAAALSGGSAGSTSGIAGGMSAVGGAMTAGGVMMANNKATRSAGAWAGNALKNKVGRPALEGAGRAFSAMKGIGR
jgi:type IV secretory pathway VirB6-like protein